MLQRNLDNKLLNEGPDAHNVGVANNNLGVFHAKRGEYVQAKRYFKEALRIFTKVYGPEHPETIGLKKNLERLKKFM